MRLIPTQSSNISAIAYDPDEDYFYAVFKNQSVYRYDCDTAEITRREVTAILFDDASQGKAFDDFKKLGYAYEKIEDESIMEDWHV